VADAFVSYSRRDAEFVHTLVAELQARGKSVWIDTEGIGDGEVFPDAIRWAIESSEAFIFVITPESVASRYCESEVDYALSLNKRLVPLLREPVAEGSVPEPVAVRNWIPFTAEMAPAPATDRLVAALEADLEHLHAHTHWLVKAREWEAKQHERSVLLRGSELAAAEAWLAGAGERTDPAPTMLQRSFVAASRSATSRRQRLTVIASLAVAAVALVLGVFALISRGEAVSAQKKATGEAVAATSRLWASEALAQLVVDPERSILIAMAAVRKDPTPDAVFALRRALDVSPARARLAGVGTQFVYWGPGISYRPDGRRIAEGSSDGYIRIFDASSGRLIARIRIGAPAPIVQYNPAGTLVAVVTGANGVSTDVRIVDPASGRTRLRLPAAGGLPSNLVFSADGSVLYFADSSKVVRWDLRTGRARVLANAGFDGVGASLGVFEVALSPDGRRLAVGGWPGVAIMDASTGRVLTSSTAGYPWWIAFTPDGRGLGVAAAAPWPSSGVSGSLALLDPRTLLPVHTYLHLDGDAVVAFAFSADGTRLAFGTNEGQAGVYDLRSGNQLVSFPGHTTNIFQVAFSPDGREVATAAGDGNAVIWRATGAETQSIWTGGVNSAVNGWNVTDLAFTAGRVLARYSPTGGPDAGEEVIRSWTASGTPVGAPFVVGTGPRSYARISANGRYALTGEFTPSGTLARLTVWDIAKGRRLATLGVPPSISAAAFSPDGAWIAFAYTQGLEARQIATGRTVKLPLFSPGCGFLYYSFGAGDRLIAGNDACGNAAVWSTRTGRLAGHVLHFVGFINLGPPVLSSDGTELAVANSANPGQVAIVDVATGRTVSVLTGDTRGIQDLAFSPDGSLLATASLDGTARIWNARTGQQLRILDQPDGLDNVAFSPDGSQLATLDYAGVIRIFPTCPDCTNPRALLALARARVTRALTAAERRTFLG